MGRTTTTTKGNEKKGKGRQVTKRPGVRFVNLKRAGGVTVQARWTDPATGQVKRLALVGSAYSTVAKREAWGRALSETLAKQRAEIKSGVKSKTRTSPTDAAAAFLAHFGREVDAGKRRPATLRSYMDVVQVVAAWWTAQGVEATEGLTYADLVALGDHLAHRPRMAPVKGKGAGRGRRKAVMTPRSQSSVQHDVRQARPFLSYLRKRGMLNLSAAEIADALPVPTVPTTPDESLSPDQAQKLLAAALRADPHWTGKVPPSVVVAVLTLSGLRRAEFLRVDWSAFLPDYRDETGEVVGALVVEPHVSKTRHRRVVSCACSPALREILRRWRLRCAPGTEGAIFGAATNPEEIRRVFVDLQKTHGAPSASPQVLRRTCGTTLATAPGISGAAGPFMAAARLGHGVRVAQGAYWTPFALPRDARTIEAALGVEELVAQVLAPVGRKGRKSAEAKTA